MTDLSWIGYVVGVGGLVVGLSGWLRNQRGDSAEQARWMGKVDAKLDQIALNQQGLNGIPERVKAMETGLTEIKRTLEKHIETEARK